MEYAESVRARMVRRMLGPNAVTARRLAAETGIAQPTLSRWLRAAASIKDVSTKPPASPPEPSTPSKRPQDWTALERAQAVLAASQLSDAALGEFLRRQGLHREQLEEWKRALEEALAQPGGADGPPGTPSASRSSSGSWCARTRRWRRPRRCWC
jgi:transposase-like protein